VVLGVPNFSEGRDPARVERISTGFATGAALLDAHSDPVHNRTVLSLSGPTGSLADGLVNGARACVREIDMTRHDGAHPCVGALDVCPVVWLSDADRGSARDEALSAARRIAAEAGVPVFLYGDLAAHPSRRERAFFREGGLVELGARMAGGELRPDFGAPEPHPTAGVTLVTARPPLAAFNLELEGAGTDAARAIASRLRESGGGLPGVRAIAVDLGKGRAQISTNVHDPIAVPLAEVVDRVRALASPFGASVAAAEIVGLVPEAALAAWPEEIPIPAFDRAKHVIERRVQI
jgi:glutamate formiminotransferase / 5-formyltetrahydrofolate cyclo-ligase